MYLPSKLYAVALLMLLCIVVDAKLPDTTILRGPDCAGKSRTRTYNYNVWSLINSFVKDTPTSSMNIRGDRQMNHSYPNRNPGSPFGFSTCYQDLGKFDCRNCLVSAKARLETGCLHPIAATIRLQDCSINYNITVGVL
ncbi:hypothetical protein LINGRAHAP2_LOCUS17606 [Linum grandiflorum]